MRTALNRLFQPLLLPNDSMMTIASRRCRCSSFKFEYFPFLPTSFAVASSLSERCHEILTATTKTRRNFSMTSIAQFPTGTCFPPVSIGVRSTTTKVSVFSSETALDDLRHKTNAWLRIPLNSWTQHEASKGRFLIREWSEVNHGRNEEERAVQQTKILRRWVEEFRAKTNNNKQTRPVAKIPKSHDKEKQGSREMVEMLNRCLDSWRKAATASTSTGIKTGTATRNRSTPQSESMGLIRLFHELAESLNDRDLLPNEKTYSMCMNVLSLHPESTTVCDDVLSILRQSRKTATPDQQFYNVCLHTLAKCASHHPEAPLLVERIFREMTTASDIAPNTACFVSVLHAWANSIPISNGTKDHRSSRHSERETDATVSAAERAEAVLNQMVHDYPELVDTICFNVCIDAWGRQGNPEKAEAIFRRLYEYDRHAENGDRDDPSLHRRKGVKPNEISFNSAINAWSKSASFGGYDNSAKEKAAERAGRLFQQMKVQGLEPTPETFGGVMEAYSNTPNPGARVENFLDEIETMYSRGEISLPPSKVCYLIAIQAWGRTKPGGAERAESLLRRMEEISSQEDGDRDELQPCTILYTALISAWAQSDDECAPDRARELFLEMGRKAKSGITNTSPNVVTLNALLNAFCNHGRIDEAREYLSRSKRVMRPDTTSYLTILKAYAKSSSIDAAEEAQDFLSELEDDHYRGEGTVRPTVHMYSQLLMAWGNSSRSDSAFRAEEIFWRMLMETGEENAIDVQPDTATFNCVLRAWSKSSEGGAPDRAEAFLRKVRQEHSDEIRVDPVSHLYLIYTWAHSGRRKAPIKAEEYLEEARELCRNSGKHSDFRLKRSHFNGAILAWKKSNDNNAAFHIRKLEEERDSTAVQ